VDRSEALQQEKQEEKKSDLSSFRRICRNSQ